MMAPAARAGNRLTGGGARRGKGARAGGAGLVHRAMERGVL